MMGNTRKSFDRKGLLHLLHIQMNVHLVLH
jgi:hypothetical protein